MRIIDKTKKYAKRIRNRIYKPKSEHEKKVIDKCSEYENSVLISGYPKSGNTWTRFVVFNYVNVVLNEAKETLTYDELNEIQPTVLPRKTTVRGCKRASLFLVRTHSQFYELYKYFDTVVHVYRNPLDSLISLYKTDVKRKNVEEKNINEYVVNRLGEWINHFQSVYKKSDVSLSYKKRKEDPMYEFENMIMEIFEKVDKDALKKSVNLSSISNIREMEKKKDQWHGNYPKSRDEFDDDFNFTRSGKTGQYKSELKKETIRNCKKKIREKEIEEPVL